MKRTALSLLTLLILSLAAAHPAIADVQLSNVFGDHMVLQQERPIRVFGRADPDEEITVEFAGNSANARTGADGYFRIELPPMKADGKVHQLSVSGKTSVTINDVQLGEVWICSGQSNMEWAVNNSLNAKEEIASAIHSQIRLFNVGGHVQGPDTTDDARGSWQICSPETVRGFSAVGYFFGRAIQKKLDVPVGLVGTNWGGTRIEPWTPLVGFQQVPELQDYVDNLNSADPSTPQGKAYHEKYLATVAHWIKQAESRLIDGKAIGDPPRFKFSPKGGATYIYNGMVHSLKPLSVRGVIWYQGESNAGDGLRYEYLKEALVKGWRSVFENEELSFYWVQLANFQQPSDDPAGGGWGDVREGQRRALRIPKTGMAVIIDIGEANDIHPRNKQDVGERLAIWALANDYGQEIICSGPLYKSMQAEGDKIRISFDHVGAGLVTAKKVGLELAKEVDTEELTQFAIQSADNKWHWANAKIDGDTVVVWADGVKNPKHVRFGYQSNPVGLNLYNKEGLPASPFTTE